MSLRWEVDEVAWFWLTCERKVIGWAADMFFLGGGCLKHERNKERAGLARRGDGTTTEPIGAGAD